MCSVSCLKFILGFFTFATLVIGIAGIVFGSIQLANIGKVDFDSFNPGEITGALLLTLGILSFFIGVIGLCGSLKKNKCCLCIFQFAVFPLVIISLVIASFATYAAVMHSELSSVEDSLSKCLYTDQTSSDNCEKCGNNGALKWVKTANDALYNVNQSLFGQQEDCYILAASKDDAETYGKWGFKFVTYPDNADLPGVKGNTNALQCQIEGKLKQWGQFMNYFESEFKCSGMCSVTPFYAFYDSKIIPEDKPSCYGAITNFFSSDMVLGISWAIFAFFFLNLVLSCCLCCHPDRKKEVQEGGAYARMQYMD